MATQKEIEELILRTIIDLQVARDWLVSARASNPHSTTSYRMFLNGSAEHAESAARNLALIRGGA